MTNSNEYKDSPRIKFATEEGYRVWDEHGNNEIPVVIKAVIKSFGITAVGMDLDIETSGFTREGIIIFNDKHSINRKRFTLAHELGHIVLDHTSMIGESSQSNEDYRESEANAFANSLLMPRKDLYQFMKSKNKNITEIAQRYQISEESVTWTLYRNTRLFNFLKT